MLNFDLLGGNGVGGFKLANVYSAGVSPNAICLSRCEAAARMRGVLTRRRLRTGWRRLGTPHRRRPAIR